MLVLVVDDEPMIRMTYLALLSQMAEVTAVGAASVAEALALITAAPPHLVVLDLQLPDGSGLDVLATLGTAQIPVFLIVISTHLEEYRGRLPQSDRLYALGKPASLHELQLLIEHVQRATQPPSPFSVVDYVQLACMGKHSVIIDCRSVNATSEIVVRKGELFSARDELGKGVPAFNRLILAENHQVRIRAESGKDGERNLYDRWEQLVLEAMRVRDEQSSVSRNAGKVSDVKGPDRAEPTISIAKPGVLPVQVMAQPVASEAAQIAFAECIEKALRAVVARNYAVAIAEFEKAQAIRPDDALLCHRLERLRRLRPQAE